LIYDKITAASWAASMSRLLCSASSSSCELRCRLAGGEGGRAARGCPARTEAVGGGIRWSGHASTRSFADATGPWC